MQLVDVLQTKFDVEKLCSSVNKELLTNSTICSSMDAGLYLCEYCLFKSLSLNEGWSLFIHVPDYHSWPDGRKMLPIWANELACIIKMAIDQRKASVVM